MPRNPRRLFLSEHAKDYDKSVKIHEADVEKNEGRQALYVTIKRKNSSSKLKNLPSMQSQGFVFLSDHLSVDEDCFHESSDFPAEHYTAVYINASTQEEIILHGPYEVLTNEIDVENIKARKNSRRDGLTRFIEPVQLSADDKNIVVKNAGPYTRFRNDLVNRHNAALENLEEEINILEEKIKQSLLNMEEISKDDITESFSQTRKLTLQEVLTLLEKIEIYHKYATEKKYIDLQHYYRNLVRILESLVVSPVYMSPPNIASSVASVEDSSRSLSIAAEQPKSVVRLSKKQELMQKIARDIEEVDRFNRERSNDPELALKMNVLLQETSLDLIALFCDDAIETTVDLRSFVAEKEAYLKTCNAVENCFNRCIENGDFDGVKILMPHLRDKIKEKDEAIFDVLYRKCISEKQNVPNNFFRIAEYLYQQGFHGYESLIATHKNSVEFRINNGVPFLFSKLHEHFLLNQVAAFEFFLNFSMICGDLPPAFEACSIVLNIAQSIILQFSSNPNLKFIDLLSRFDLQNYCPLAIKALVKAVCIREESGVEIYSSYMAGKVGQSKEAVRLFEKQSKMQCFELLLSMIEMMLDPKNSINISIELVEYLLPQINLDQVFLGLEKLLNNTAVCSRIRGNANDSKTTFYNNVDLCDQDMPRRLGQSDKLCLFFYGTPDTDEKFMAILAKILNFAVEKFCQQSIEEQKKLISFFRDRVENQMQNIALLAEASGTVLVAQVLNSLIRTPDAEDYYTRIQLLYWRSDLALKVGINLAAVETFYMIAQKTLAQMYNKYLFFIAIVWSKEKISSLQKSDAMLAKKIKDDASTQLSSNMYTAFFSAQDGGLDSLLKTYKISKDLSDKKRYEFLLRALAQQGNIEGMCLFFVSPKVRSTNVDVNAIGEKSKKTALHQLAYGANHKDRKASIEDYQKCLTLLLQQGAEFSLDSEDKMPKDYDTASLLDFGQLRPKR